MGERWQWKFFQSQALALGKPSVVIVSAEEWARKTVRKGTLAEFLMTSPLRDADLDLERVRDQPRDVEL